jgi:ethanolamine ammonia-lyase large subunit
VYVADLAKNIIGKCFTNFGEEIAVAIRHGDKLSSMEDATNAADALMEIADSKYKVEYGWNLQRRKNILDKIREIKECIRRDEQNKDEVFNEAADAMNTLNEDFGIEIDF